MPAFSRCAASAERTAVRFGFTLGVDTPRPRDLVEVVEAAEGLGFHAFYVGDHVIIPRAVDESAHRREVGGSVDFADKTQLDVFDPFLTLSYLASRVSRIKLGFSILVLPYRNPLVTAKMLATLDVHSEGRLIVGVGAGWIKEEFDALGANYHQRGEVTDEWIQIMVELWTKETPEFHGAHYEFADVAFRPKPVQSPYVPILIGGSGKRALRRVAELGDGWLPLFLSPDELARGRDSLAALCEVHGRDLSALSIVPSSRVRLGETAHAPTRALLTGTADEVRGDVARYEAAGADEIILVIVEPDLDLDQLLRKIEWFGLNIIPK